MHLSSPTYHEVVLSIQTGKSYFCSRGRSRSEWQTVWFFHLFVWHITGGLCCSAQKAKQNPKPHRSEGSRQTDSRSIAALTLLDHHSRICLRLDPKFFKILPSVHAQHPASTSPAFPPARGKGYTVKVQRLKRQRDPRLLNV